MIIKKLAPTAQLDGYTLASPMVNVLEGESSILSSGEFINVHYEDQQRVLTQCIM